MDVGAFCSWSTCMIRILSIARVNTGLVVEVLARRAEHHVDEVLDVAKRVLRIHERLPEVAFRVYHIAVIVGAVAIRQNAESSRWWGLKPSRSRVAGFRRVPALA